MTATHRYFTTPIYYATGDAHVGHLYANSLLTVFRNHHHLRGRETLTLTGLDEHGEKVEESAKAQGLSPQNLVDGYAVKWKKVFADFGLPHDVFLRTTSSEHVANVKAFLEASHAKGDIYYGEHEGRYCLGCEAFLTDKEMDAAGACLIHKRPTEIRKEGNYYFRTSKYSTFAEKVSSTPVSSWQHLGTDTDRICSFVSDSVVDFSTDCLMIIGTAVILAIIDWRLAIV